MPDILQAPSELAPLLPQEPHRAGTATELTLTLGQEVHVGGLSLHAGGTTTCSAFRYSASWLNRRDAIMVSPELRPTRSSQWSKPSRDDSRNVFAALVDTAPQGFGLSVIQRAQERGLLDFFRAPGQEQGPWDALCLVPDVARLGALRLHPAHQAPPNGHPEPLLLPHLADLGAIAQAVHAFELVQEDLRQLLLLVHCATALAGTRPKCTFIQDDGQLAVATFPQASDTYPVTRLQVLIARIAKAAEIDVLAHRLLHPVTHPIVLVPRFDRAPGGKRAPFLSAQSLLLANTDDTIDHLELLGAMRAHSKEFVSDARQLWCRLLLSCLLNHDGLSLRKVGFLYAGKSLWRLAPACGLLPNLELTLNNAQRPTKGLWLDSTLDMLLEDSGAFEVQRTEASLVLRRQFLALQGWKVMARQFDVNMSDSDMALLEPVMHNSNIKRARELLDA